MAKRTWWLGSVCGGDDYNMPCYILADHQTEKWTRSRTGLYPSKPGHVEQEGTAQSLWEGILWICDGEAHIIKAIPGYQRSSGLCDINWGMCQVLCGTGPRKSHCMRTIVVMRLIVSLSMRTVRWGYVRLLGPKWHRQKPWVLDMKLDNSVLGLLDSSSTLLQFSMVSFSCFVEWPGEMWRNVWSS